MLYNTRISSTALALFWMVAILSAVLLPAHPVRAASNEWVDVHIQSIGVVQPGDWPGFNDATEFKFYAVARHDASEETQLSTFPSAGVIKLNPDADGWYIAIPDNLSISLSVPASVNHIALYVTAVDSDLLGSELKDSALIALINDKFVEILGSQAAKMFIKLFSKSKNPERFLNSALVTKFAGVLLEELMQEDELGVIRLDLYRQNGWRGTDYPFAVTLDDPPMWLQYEVRVAASPEDAIGEVPTNPGQVAPINPVPAVPAPTGLLDGLYGRLATARVNNPYSAEARLFAEALAAHQYDFDSGSSGISPAMLETALTSNDVGDRINGLVNEVWGDWLGRVHQHDISQMTDPGSYGFSPFRQLTIRLIQGWRGTLSAQEQRALYCYFTRHEDPSVWSSDMDGVIGAVNRECF